MGFNSGFKGLNIGEKPKGFTDMVPLFYCGLCRVFTVRVHAYIAKRDFVELSNVSVSSFFHDIKFI